MGGCESKVLITVNMSSKKEKGKAFAKGFFEYFGKSCPACLINMVQGDVFRISLHHWEVAVRTGLLTGVFGIVFLLFETSKKFIGDPFRLAVLTAIFTAISDLIIVPSHFGGVYGEAITTGMTAGLISFGWFYLEKSECSKLVRIIFAAGLIGVGDFLVMLTNFAGKYGQVSFFGIAIVLYFLGFLNLRRQPNKAELEQ